MPKITALPHRTPKTSAVHFVDSCDDARLRRRRFVSQQDEMTYTLLAWEHHTLAWVTAKLHNLGLGAGTLPNADSLATNMAGRETAVADCETVVWDPLDLVLLSPVTLRLCDFVTRKA